MDKQITLNFEIDDVFGLYHTSARSFYFKQIDRFEELSAKPKVFTKDKKLFMYWIDGYVSVLLFTKILNAFGYLTLILDDLAKEAEEINEQYDRNYEYVVLTDFAGNWGEVA